MIFQSTLHFTAFFMYTVWTTKLTCNSDGAQMSTQKQKNMPLGLPAKRAIKAFHLIQDHCGSMRDASHYLTPRTTFSFPTPPCLTQTPMPTLSLDSTYLPQSYSSSQLSWLLTAREAELGWGGLSSASHQSNFSNLPAAPRLGSLKIDFSEWKRGCSVGWVAFFSALPREPTDWLLG